MKLLKSFLCLVAVFIAVKASGDFVVLHSPNSVIFHGNEEVEQSLLKEVLAAALGFTVKLRGVWSGMSITNPFSLPEAVVAVVIEGIDSLETPKGKRFPLNVNEVEETTWQALRERLEERDNDNTLVRISLGDGLDALGQSALGELKPTPIDESSLRALNLRKEEDKKFLEEVQLLHAIAKKVPSAIKPDSKPDIYWLVISGLRPIFDAYGNNATASRESLSLLNNALNVIHDAFIQAYDGQVLIVAFTNDASKVHHIRSVTLERQRREADEEITDEDNENDTTELPPESNTFVTYNAKDINDLSKALNNLETSLDAIAAIETALLNKNLVELNEELNGEESNTSSPSPSESYNETGNTTPTIDIGNIANKEYTINSNTQNTGQERLNLAQDYSENYPVIFNILLWFGVVFVFSLLAICISIAGMDPGRDSIIYRMTSNRMKKDN